MASFPLPCPQPPDLPLEAGDRRLDLACRRHRHAGLRGRPAPPGPCHPAIAASADARLDRGRSTCYAPPLPFPTQLSAAEGRGQRAPSMASRYDIVILADPRFPGGTSTALASEIEAQARAGYRTALLALKGPVLKRSHPFHPAIRTALDAGFCELVDPTEPLAAPLLLIHHPQVLSFMPQARLRLEAERQLVIVHHPPFDGDGAPFYDWAEVHRNAEALLGGAPVWAPVGPRVREQLVALSDPPPLTGQDWHSILDPTAWALPETGALGPLPVIGRHSRPDLLKWPETAEQILEIYPAAPDIRVRILGLPLGLPELLGGLPANWTVVPFNAMPARDFLGTVDFFVYYHHRRFVEAFGRAVLEALAAGRVAVLPPPFIDLFEDAAVYAAAAGAAPLVHQLHADAAARTQLRRRAIQLVGDRFSPGRHAERLRALIGPPAPPTARPSRPPRRILFFTSNGVGLGHLTRALAIARRLGPALEPVIVTLSQGARLAESMGILTEYLPFRTHLGVETGAWNRALAHELGEMLRFYAPAALVFDGNMPYQGLLNALAQRPETLSVWVRRAMWRATADATALARQDAFDAVIEPGDIAETLDQGPTVALRDTVHQVAPMRLLDPDEMLSREAARHELGLDGAAVCVLVQLGSGNNFAYDDVRGPALGLLASRPGVEVVVLGSPIGDQPVELPPGVHQLELFPISRYYRAFDLVVSAVGYNAFHELLHAGVPSLLVPNENPIMDDQQARALHAERRGFAIAHRTSDVYLLRERLEELLDAAVRARMRRRMARLDPTNGAVAAARFVGELAHMGRSDRLR